MDSPEPSETEQELAQTDRQDDEEEMRYPRHQETEENGEE